MTQQDPRLSDLLRWGIENSSFRINESVATEASPRSVDPKALAALFGGPSDADLMKDSMAILVSTDTTLENKLVAFDNFEQLIENIDNANNMESLELWTPLIRLIDHEEKDIRRMTAWCIGTAVQNNPQSQERALAGGAVSKLVELTKDKDQTVKKKACYALSSEVRNYQPGMDALLRALGNVNQIDASDMGAVDDLMSKLRL